MLYYIKKGGLFAAKPGRAKSYTNRKDPAASYTTEAEARANACGNEIIVIL